MQSIYYIVFINDVKVFFFIWKFFYRKIIIPIAKDIYTVMKLEMKVMKDEHPMGKLIIPDEGLLKEELQDEIEERIAFTVENLYHLDNELEMFVQLVKDNVEANKNSPDELVTLYNYLDEMWSVLITNDLRDVLLDTLSIVQERKHELEDILEELEETLENQEEMAR